MRRPTTPGQLTSRDDSVLDLEAGRGGALAAAADGVAAAAAGDDGVVPVQHVRRLTTTLVDILRHVAKDPRQQQVRRLARGQGGRCSGQHRGGRAGLHAGACPCAAPPTSFFLRHPCPSPTRAASAAPRLCPAAPSLQLGCWATVAVSCHTVPLTTRAWPARARPPPPPPRCCWPSQRTSTGVRGCGGGGKGSELGRLASMRGSDCVRTRGAIPSPHTPAACLAPIAPNRRRRRREALLPGPPAAAAGGLLPAAGRTRRAG